MITSELTTIERTTLIRAPRSVVWRALTTSQEFSKWFLADLDDSFEPGKRVEVVSNGPCGKDHHFYFIVGRMEPEHTFSWRWHPGAADVGEDGTTLVKFVVEEVQEGTLITVTETGFDRISLARRSKAFDENGHGWEIQLRSLNQHASKAA